MALAVCAPPLAPPNLSAQPPAREKNPITKIMRSEKISSLTEEWTEEQLIVMVSECESIVFNVAWKDSEHLDELVSALTQCRRELSFRGFAHVALVHRAI